MFHRFTLVFALALAFAAVLSTASCGPTCPTSEPNCGTANGANAGTAGSSEVEPTTCAQLTAVRKCMDAFCASATNPFCTCYKLGFDIRSDTCVCSTFNAAAFCKQADQNGVVAANYDCAAASGSVATICVGVK